MHLVGVHPKPQLRHLLWQNRSSFECLLLKVLYWYP
nr:MAG TPA: hypothetical protein [Caudoviricetes sp.]